MRDEIKAAYGKKSMKIVEINWQAIDATFDALTQVQVPAEWATLDRQKKNARHLTNQAISPISWSQSTVKKVMICQLAI